MVQLTCTVATTIFLFFHHAQWLIYIQYHGGYNYVCSLLSYCTTRMCSQFCAKMALRENNDLQDLIDFKQPPKKKNQFKYSSKKEEKLALYQYILLVQVGCSRFFCFVFTYILPIAVVYVYSAYCCCRVLSLSITHRVQFLPIACRVLPIACRMLFLACQVLLLPIAC